jgi:hypothetical protein
VSKFLAIQWDAPTFLASRVVAQLKHKLQHWRGFQAVFGSQAAPVLEIGLAAISRIGNSKMFPHRELLVIYFPHAPLPPREC